MAQRPTPDVDAVLARDKGGKGTQGTDTSVARFEVEHNLKIRLCHDVGGTLRSVFHVATD